MIRFETNSSRETQELGAKIGSLLKAGDVLALEGPLGAGKTTLVQGIAKGLEVDDMGEVVSPTFVLIHEYEGREKIYHIDWYRLSKIIGSDQLLAQECFNSEAVTLVEWADRGKKIFPKEHIRVCMKYKGHQARILDISAKGKRFEHFLRKL